MSKIIKLPGLIDPHVHLRDPGQTHKEDFYTGTSAALAGGYTTVLDMPNNLVPITTLERLENKIRTAKKKIVCDVGFYFGTDGKNLKEFAKVKKISKGLKVFLNISTGNLKVGIDEYERICSDWIKRLPILLHVEGNIVKEALKIAAKYNLGIYVCHISSKQELQQVIDAKKIGLKVSCGVTPHHLFLTDKDMKRLGPFGIMKPMLKRQEDIDFFWENLKFIDVVESDHAPHTVEEKQSNDPPFGVPGLETTLPLLLTAVEQGKITIQQIVEKCYENPKRIFKVPTDESSYSEVDLDEEYIIDNKKLKTKCKWSPFHGWKVKGKVKKVFIRGRKVFEAEKVLVKPGFGRVLQPIKEI